MDLVNLNILEIGFFCYVCFSMDILTRQSLEITTQVLPEPAADVRAKETQTSVFSIIDVAIVGA